MSERDRPGRAPEGSSFAPVPVAPGGGRRPLMVAMAVLSIVTASFAIARLTPPMGSDQAIETPQRSASSVRETAKPTETPVEPTATPLPRFEWFTGPEAPIADVLVQDAGSTRWLRLGTAEHLTGSLAVPGRDLLLAGDREGTVCLCWRATGSESGDPTALELVSLDANLGERSSHMVTRVTGLDSTGRPNGPTQVALERSPDGRFAFLARAVRSATHWQVSLDVIELASLSIVRTIDMIPAPLDDQTQVVAVAKPTLRIAPDGRHALVMSGVEREAASGEVVIAQRSWLVRLDGPGADQVQAIDAVGGPVDGVALASCTWVAFATSDRIVTGCATQADAGPANFEIRRYTLDGLDFGPVEPYAYQTSPRDVLIDSANGIVYHWDATDHALYALDVMSGAWRRSRPTAGDDLDNPTGVEFVAGRPPSGPPPVWTDGRAATDPAVDRTLVGSPDGRLLFAIGNGRDPGAGSGVRVFDAGTLGLLERWRGIAAYASVTVFENGRFLAALGRPGMTVTGGPADWAMSVTVHDTSTGQAVVRVGEVGGDGLIAFPSIQSQAVTR